MELKKKKKALRYMGGEDKWSSQDPHPRWAQKRKGISQTQRSSLRSEGFESHIRHPNPQNQNWEEEPP